jgi:hypothetical protein
MTRFRLAAAWLRAWRKARIPGLPRDGKGCLTDLEIRQWRRITQLHRKTAAADPMARKAPKGEL